MSKQTGMMSQVLTTSELMEQVQRNDVNGEQQFGVMVKQETSVAFGGSWNEGAELFLL